jgi:hypothetical protein
MRGYREGRAVKLDGIETDGLFTGCHSCWLCVHCFREIQCNESCNARVCACTNICEGGLWGHHRLEEGAQMSASCLQACYAGNYGV